MKHCRYIFIILGMALCCQSVWAQDDLEERIDTLTSQTNQKTWKQIIKEVSEEYLEDDTLAELLEEKIKTLFTEAESLQDKKKIFQWYNQATEYDFEPHFSNINEYQEKIEQLEKEKIEKEKIYTPKTKKPKKGKNKKKKKTIKTEDLFKDLEKKEEKIDALTEDLFKDLEKKEEKIDALKEKIDQLDQKTLNEKTDDILNQINEKQSGEQPAYYNQIAEKIAGLYKEEKSNENKKEIKKQYKKLPKNVQKDVLMPSYIENFKNIVQMKKINTALILQLINNINQWDDEEKEEFDSLIKRFAQKIKIIHEKTDSEKKDVYKKYYDQLPEEIKKEIPLTKPKEEKPKPAPRPTKKPQPPLKSKTPVYLKTITKDLCALWAHI